MLNVEILGDAKGAGGSLLKNLAVQQRHQGTCEPLAAVCRSTPLDTTSHSLAHCSPASSDTVMISCPLSSLRDCWLVAEGCEAEGLAALSPMSLSNLRVGRSETRSVLLQVAEEQVRVDIRLTLVCQLRADVKLVMKAVRVASDTVDDVIDYLQPSMELVYPWLTRKTALVMGLAAGGSALAVSPVVIALLVVAFPIVFPLLVFMLASGAASLMGAAAIAALSRPGRLKIQSASGPLFQLSAMPVIAVMIYETGSEAPLAFQIIEQLVPVKTFNKLLVALALDFIGNSSYALPLLGEGTDLVWGPLQASIVACMFKGEVPPTAAYASALEEILPFTDIIPSATMLWMKVCLPTFLQERALRKKDQ